MGDFTQRARARIKRAVKWTELQQFGGGVGTNGPGGVLDGRPQWFELQGTLSPGGTVTGHPLLWNELDNTGDGAYTTDTTDFTLTDTTGQHWGLHYEIVLARPVATDNGVAWEVLTSGAGFHAGTIPTVPASGYDVDCSIEIAGHTITVTASALYGDPTTLTDGTACGISFDIGLEAWILTQAEC
jgi:hypothetical protein